jgi:hypothetical protein
MEKCIMMSPKPKMFWHFIHSMEHLYWSWSVYYNKENNDIIYARPRSKYVISFTNAIRNHENIHLTNDDCNERAHIISQDTLSEHELSTRDEDLFIRNSPLLGWFKTVESARSLRNYLIPLSPIRKRMRIGIIHRTKTDNRYLVNSILIKKYVQIYFRTKVTEIYFNNLTFEQQILFCNQHDVIISSHGAQLGSIPFMSDYSLVIELCNKEYYLPNYFGSLALNSGKSYALVCKTHDPKYTNIWKKQVHQKLKNRFRNTGRSQPILITLDIIKKIIRCLLLFNQHRNMMIEQQNPNHLFKQRF